MQHILLVDDDYVTLQTMKEFLVTLDYQVTTAEDCRQATEALRKPEKIDLMILDYLMPDGNGTDVLQSIALQKDLQRPPVIISSNIVESRNPYWEDLLKRLPHLSQSLIYAFVNKPYVFDQIEVILRETLKEFAKKSEASSQVLTGDYRSTSLTTQPSNTQASQKNTQIR